MPHHNLVNILTAGNLEGPAGGGGKQITVNIRYATAGTLGGGVYSWFITRFITHISSPLLPLFSIFIPYGNASASTAREEVRPIILQRAEAGGGNTKRGKQITTYDSIAVVIVLEYGLACICVWCARAKASLFSLPLFSLLSLLFSLLFSCLSCSLVSLPLLSLSLVLSFFPFFPFASNTRVDFVLHVDLSTLLLHSNYPTHGLPYPTLRVIFLECGVLINALRCLGRGARMDAWCGPVVIVQYGTVVTLVHGAASWVRLFSIFSCGAVQVW